ncbi:hypothetical protein JMA_26710 [Jeotgalibacillus malaysiensis]|uniref:Uncharacterized protein n=1 Tax=Jeotgalibacillus malaysiensis TaxID=1508404 RepID=A0A0B5ATT6_9BACL|nr:hypothetical protein [Jeotgalibacillus malaysiensis]AJD91988.1 hypothetical protein JMA_26710 [Jeotgalibacillus malaysiensis]
MNKITIFYGSKREFNKILPDKYSTLTELVYKIDQDNKGIVINLNDQKEDNENKERIFVENFIAESGEYAGVREHVIVNFSNFLNKFNSNNVYLHNPPLQISEQIQKLNIDVETISQNYASLTLEDLKEINYNYDSEIIGQEHVKYELLQSLYPLTLPSREKPVIILLYGSSGIGKTETAKYLAEVVGETLFRKQFSMF